MRIWSLHPKYLDDRGLVALWREALLAKKVLENKTAGYKHHPQLARFRNQKNPVAAVNKYLLFVYREAQGRDYSFDKKKIGDASVRLRMVVTDEQIEYEISHLKKKLSKRNKRKFQEIASVKKFLPHPLFKIKKGKDRKVGDT